MSESEQERRESDDEEVDPKAHKQLLQAIGKLGKHQHIRKPTRSEPALACDEFHLAKPLSTVVQTVSMGDVVHLLKKTSGHIKAGKELSKSQQPKKVLKKPLEKPVAERIQRTIGYEKAKKSLSRWDAIVERNRVAEQQVFPLDYEEVHVELPPQKKPRGASIKSDLMLEMEAVEAKLKSLKGANQTNETIDEQKLQEKITRDELIARRKELAYLRIRESQKSARARMQNKIKSKKYHKLMKREKLKEQMKEFELLQKTDPEAALAKLDSIEKNRVLERASLRHKNTGTWAKNLQVRAKYDKDVRKDLSEQLALSRELTRKKLEDENSESDKEAVEKNEKVDGENFDPFNPWLNGKKKLEQSEEVAEYMSGYRKYWLERNKNEKALEEYRNDLTMITNGKGDESDESEDQVQKMQNNSKTENVQKKSNESDDDSNEDKDSESGKTSGSNDEDETTDDSEEECSESDLQQFKALVNKSAQHNDMIEEPATEAIAENKKTGKSAKKPAQKARGKQTNRTQASPSEVEKRKPLKRKSNSVAPRRQTFSSGHSGEWRVENLDEKEPTEEKQQKSVSNLDLDDIFDDAENRLRIKVQEKMAALNEDLLDKPPTKQDKKKRKRKSDHTDLSFKVQPSRPEIDEELLETPANVTAPEDERNSYRMASAKIVESTPVENGIDPNKILHIKPKALKTALPDIVNSEEFFGDDEAQSKAQMTIAEAFEDDDIVADFEQDRADERKKSSNVEVDLTLPGWGSWAGCGISKTKKSKKLILKFPKDAPRRDDSKQNVYINEKGSKSVKQHLVSDLPFPFKSVQEYEASIRAPTGRNFVPETAFRMLTRPATLTKLGAVIEPMSDEHLVKMPKRPRTVVDKRIHMMNKKKEKSK